MQSDLTPPDTVQVRQQLLKHRAAIGEAQQQLDVDVFAGGLGSTPMETPLVGQAGAAKRAGVSFEGIPETPVADSRSGGQIVADILLHKNPPLTYLAAGGGVLVLAAAYYLTRGAHNLTLLTALSYCLLADVALNFLRSLISKQWQVSAAWVGSSWTAALAERAAAAVHALARLHDAYLASADPWVSLKVASGLWALAVMGHYLSIWSLAALAFAAAFTLPAAYAKNREAVQEGYTAAVRAVASRWDSLGLSRKQKALVLGLVLGSLWLRSAWPTRLVALLVGALAVRCHLKPAEVERIIAIAEPYTMSVKKRASRFSTVAADFAMRSVGGKSHLR